MKHRTPECWAKLVAAWKASGQSAATFCKEGKIGYASFCHWRKRLAEVPVFEEPSKQDSAPAFIDLSSLGTPRDCADGRWHIVLRLGDGIELCLRQGG